MQFGRSELGNSALSAVGVSAAVSIALAAISMAHTWQLCDFEALHKTLHGENMFVRPEKLGQVIGGAK